MLHHFFLYSFSTSYLTWTMSSDKLFSMWFISFWIILGCYSRWKSNIINHSVTWWVICFFFVSMSFYRSSDSQHHILHNIESECFLLKFFLFYQLSNFKKVIHWSTQYTKHFFPLSFSDKFFILIFYILWVTYDVILTFLLFFGRLYSFIIITLSRTLCPSFPL
jgi:hypothetical protein